MLSQVFKTNTTNYYIGAVSSTPILDGNPPAFVPTGEEFVAQDYFELKKVFNASNIHNTSLIQNLTNAECIAAYGVQFIQHRSYVLAITSQTKPNPKRSTPSFPAVFTSFYAPYSGGLGDATYLWVCPDSDSCDIAAVARDSLNWKVEGYKIDYCLSKIQPTRCKLQFSETMLAVVIVMNFIKALCMV